MAASAPRALLCVVAAVLVVAVPEAGGMAPTPPTTRVMPWMCLERCFNTTPAQIQQHLKTLEANRDVVTDVSFELFNLGPNGTLVVNNLTRVAGPLRALGFRTHAMVSSYPYPPAFLSWMRSVFRDPGPFIARCIAAAREHGLTGLNIDWEPTTQASAEDAQDYASFLTVLSDRLHTAGLEVSVDVGSWSPIWNLTLLGASGVDHVMTMSTYTANATIWAREFAQAIEAVPLSRLAIGLQDNQAKHPLDAAGLSKYLSACRAHKVNMLAVWSMPVPAFWWPQLRAYAAANSVDT